ncbi:DUF2063 domain-containing protein [Halioglobus japonicus]|uniref:DUF2063 domain-containing protein n=1 Tax=Halioglobus japonicus TaxID=930805 RepID=A0AAP8MH07_9GAMM|nr:putative DNA-binding domain-containing protein [Halioglobus japonicus]AQA19373.1 DUF2063 domain-containing protein [Halioglobus japonicus]PLW87575.1 DUF2063 domain-containing protein [Halioglobus japonicus]GHD07723.1 DUF2063 domain-containing protein [Halioglobus japonicus]
MTVQQLRDSQMRMASYLRDPEHNPAPEQVEERRLKVYRDLIYNNVEGFIRGGFPVLRSLYAEDEWRALVRAFLDGHRCRSPYFLEISQEFIQFLMNEHTPRPCDPPFLDELAHYEWVELALDVAEQELPPRLELDDTGSALLTLSPLAWVLAYQFPVHHIGPGFKPEAPADPCYLVVYRDRHDEVKFIEINAATARLLELFRDGDAQPVDTLLATLANELGMPLENMQAFALEQVEQMLGLDVLVAQM